MLVILLILSLMFGVWAFSSRQDYKSNLDTKVTAAIVVAKQQASTLKDTQFAEFEKSPLRTYSGPQAYGSLNLQYPKSWSGYVDDTGTSNILLESYFSLNLLSSFTSSNSVFALRMQVSNQSYSETVRSVSQTQGTSIIAYVLPKLPNQVGIKLSGTLPNSKQGVMVVLPLRDKTLLVWTETNQFSSDFNNYILPNLSFSP